MAVSVVFGRQQAIAVEPAEPVDDTEVEFGICRIGRATPTSPLDIRLGDAATLSRRAVEVRCIDGSWWQLRRVGVNGVAVRTERDVRMPVTEEWTDIPARFGAAYVSVTARDQVFEFKVEPVTDIAGTPLLQPAPTGRPVREGPTWMVPRVGWWRVALALCEPALRDESEHIPTNPEISRRLVGCGLDSTDVKPKTVEKRVAYLYQITGITPGDRAGLVRRLINARIVTLLDVQELL